MGAGEIGDLTGAFNAMIGELRRSIETLEQRVAERTRELQEQTDARVQAYQAGQEVR